MTLKDKMKTYNFWISLVSAVLLLVRIIGDKYGFAVDAGLVMDITTGVCGIFVILGIISAPQKNQTNNNKENSVMNQVEDQKVEQNCALDSSNVAVGRFQNVLLAMGEKVQNDKNTIENDAQKVQNAQKHIENASQIADCNMVQCDQMSGDIINDNICIEGKLSAVDVQPIVDVENVDIQSNVEIANIVASHSDLDALIEVEDVVNDNVARGESIDAVLSQEDLKDNDLVIDSTNNSLESMIAELSAEERAQLARMLLNS